VAWGLPDVVVILVETGHPGEAVGPAEVVVQAEAVVLAEVEHPVVAEHLMAPKTGLSKSKLTNPLKNRISSPPYPQPAREMTQATDLIQ
jgi:hypothetical protein